MKIVIPDDYQDCVRHLICFDRLQHHDVQIFNDTVSDLDAKVERFKDAEAIVLTRERTVIDRSLIERLPNLKVISQTGKIAPHVDIAACKERGITVMDGRGSGSATAEMALLLILASLRNIVPEVNRLQSGKWQGALGRQLSGKVLGVYGFGRIGQQVCQLGKAFGAHILVWGRDTSLARAKALGFEVATSKESFFSVSDIISLQLRLNAETTGVVTAADLALMKSDAILVNTSRAELIEQGALYTGLKLGHPGFAAIDVYETEPILNAADPLLQLPNCLCTPHLGFVEKDNYEAYFGIAFDNINSFVDGNIQNRVV
jgi:D-3-phosphoglycerate dehydrogenase